MNIKQLFMKHSLCHHLSAPAGAVKPIFRERETAMAKIPDYLTVDKEIIYKYVRTFPYTSGVPENTPPHSESSYFSDTPGQEDVWRPFYLGFLRLLDQGIINDIILIHHPFVCPDGVEQSIHMTGPEANQIIARLKELFAS